jgi:hypothetical protein
MFQLLTVIHHGALGLAASGLLYAGSATTAALVALLAPGSARRRDARKVLALLLRRTITEENPTPPANSQ